MSAILPSPSACHDSFPREADLVCRFVQALQTGTLPWGPVEIACEWDYQTGITDVLARTEAGEFVAFEAKLSDWRRAAHQAYRNTVFAQRAYVVLPSKVAIKAARFCEVFSRFQIGLCSVDEYRIDVLIEAPNNEVLIPWLHRRAANFFDHESREQKVRSYAAGRGGDLSSNRRVA